LHLPQAIQKEIWLLALNDHDRDLVFLPRAVPRKVTPEQDPDLPEPEELDPQFDLTTIGYPADAFGGHTLVFSWKYYGACLGVSADPAAGNWCFGDVDEAGDSSVLNRNDSGDEDEDNDGSSDIDAMTPARAALIASYDSEDAIYDMVNAMRNFGSDDSSLDDGLDLRSDGGPDFTPSGPNFATDFHANDNILDEVDAHEACGGEDENGVCHCNCHADESDADLEPFALCECCGGALDDSSSEGSDWEDEKDHFPSERFHEDQYHDDAETTSMLYAQKEPGILLACKEIRSECLPLYYGTNAFSWRFVSTT
jgi:hypothetical protein